MVYTLYSRNIAPTTFAVRTDGDVRSLLPGIRRLMQEKGATVDGDVMTGTDYAGREWRQERLLAGLLIFLGATAILISAVGIYGLLSYMVSGRSAELGIRIALGAQPSKIIYMIIRESNVPVAAGILLGVFASFASARWIQSILFGISNYDPATMLVSAIVLVLTAAAAAWVPAWRASRIDPIRGLRSE